MDTALTTPSAIAGLGGTLAIAATIAVPLRFYARYKQHTIYGLDDWAIIPAYVRIFSIRNLISNTTDTKNLDLLYGNGC